MSTALKPASQATGTSIAITGGKGGVGKSNLTVNLAVALGRWGRRVLLVDGDLGLANLDVLLGLVPKRNVEDLVRGEATLEELLIDGPDGVRILPAASGVPDLSRLDQMARSRLLGALSDTASLADDVLIDTGAGLGEATLALQLAASRVLIVTTPEPTSMVDAYATLKVLWTADASKPVDVVVNAADNEETGRWAYEQISRAAEHFLGQVPGWLGPVVRDEKVGEAVRRQQALLELFPGSQAGRCYRQIAMQLTAGTDRAAESSDDFWRRLMDPSNKELSH
ncbi:hypothetical protein ABI59_14620 [Acidobacteria bacterium Mor1]|nr:hypothetical protein ABI59_14620 [Acidobacteria bacterium Mor1]